MFLPGKREGGHVTQRHLDHIRDIYGVPVPLPPDILCHSPSERITISAIASSVKAHVGLLGLADEVRVMHRTLVF